MKKKIDKDNLNLIKRKLSQYISVTRPQYIDENGGEFSASAYSETFYDIDSVVMKDDDGNTIIKFIFPCVIDVEDEHRMMRWIRVFMDEVVMSSWEAHFDRNEINDIMCKIVLT